MRQMAASIPFYTSDMGKLILLSIVQFVTLHTGTCSHGFSVLFSFIQLSILALIFARTTRYLQMFSCLAVVYCDETNATGGRKQHRMNSPIIKKANLKVAALVSGTAYSALVSR